MGGGGLDAAYVSFLVFWLRQRHFGMVFWCDFGICFGVCFDDFCLCTYLYGCKYHYELCFKAPISGMGVISL